MNYPVDASIPIDEIDEFVRSSQVISASKISKDLSNITKQSKPKKGKTKNDPRIVWDHNGNDRNGFKSELLKAAYVSQFHINGAKGEAFEQIASDFSSESGIFHNIKGVQGKTLQNKYNDIIKEVKTTCGLTDSKDWDSGRSKCELPYQKLAIKIMQEEEQAEELGKMHKDILTNQQNSLEQKENNVLVGVLQNAQNSSNQKRHSLDRSYQSPDVVTKKQKVNVMSTDFNDLCNSLLGKNNNNKDSDLVDKIVHNLRIDDVQTIKELLHAAGVSEKGIELFVAKTGFELTKPAVKLIRCYVECFNSGSPIVAIFPAIIKCALNIIVQSIFLLSWATSWS
jgi:hypothetical protein